MSGLKATMGANALSCAVFGLLFVLAPAPVASFLGWPPAPTLVIAGVGAALLVNALHLVYVARRSTPSRWAVVYFSVGDGLWVAATLALILTGTWITAPAGIGAALAVAGAVGTFGALQWRHRPRLAGD